MKIDIKDIIIALLVLVILFLDPCNWWRNRGNIVPEPPQVKKEEKQKSDVKKDEDSISAIIKPLEKELEEKDKRLGKLSNELLDGQDAILKLQQNNDSLLSLLKASELADNLSQSAGDIREQIRKNDSICRSAIAEYIRKYNISEKILSSEKDKYGLLKKNFDSCIQGSSAFREYSTKIKPKPQLVISGEVFFRKVELPKVFIAGAGIRFKNGTIAMIKFASIHGEDYYGGQLIYPISFKK